MASRAASQVTLACRAPCSLWCRDGRARWWRGFVSECNAFNAIASTAGTCCQSNRFNAICYCLVAWVNKRRNITVLRYVQWTISIRFTVVTMLKLKSLIWITRVQMTWLNWFAVTAVSEVDMSAGGMYPPFTPIFHYDTNTTYNFSWIDSLVPCPPAAARRSATTVDAFQTFQLFVDVALVSVLCVFGFIGNALTIVTLRDDIKNKKNTTNWLLQVKLCRSAPWASYAQWQYIQGGTINAEPRYHKQNAWWCSFYWSTLYILANICMYCIYFRHCY